MSKLVDLDCELVHETDKAWLFDFGGPEAVWIPKSVGEWDEKSGQVTVPESYATKQGLV